MSPAVAEPDQVYVALKAARVPATVQETAMASEIAMTAILA